MHKPVRRYPRTSIALLLIVLAWLHGCGAPPEQPATVLSANVVATGDVNSSGEELGRPVVVRLYELKSAGAFTSADFFSLYEKEAETLGADLLGREEVSVAPGQFQHIEKRVAPEAAYLGVLVAFRDIDQSQWRTFNYMKPDVTNTFTVKVGANSVSVAGQ